ncbi:uncharacterized protein [Lolium perenne]|uniref:uncharacterized protein n=1 Tax=Lolium perenne TaxID=4522 RepID=UPI0021F54AB9|nr:uncharacterized protein LOC127304259 [Lolium perenne]
MAPPPKPPPPPDSLSTKAEARVAGASPSSSSTQSSLISQLYPQLASMSFADTISDVSPFIPITLDLPSHNYYHWHHLLEVHLGRCNLLDHVAPDSYSCPADPRWANDNLAIIQWIYTRISTEIFNLFFRDASSSAALWSSLRQLFQDNVDARVNNLQPELCNTVQGDSSVGVYYQRLKSIADELR